MLDLDDSAESGTGVLNRAQLRFSIIVFAGKRVVTGSLIGGMKETQEMMDLCGKYNITCDIELVKTNYINQALERLAKNDVRYRFVIDIGTESRL